MYDRTHVTMEIVPPALGKYIQLVNDKNYEEYALKVVKVLTWVIIGIKWKK